MIPHATTVQDPPLVAEWLYRMEKLGYTPENGWETDYYGNMYYKLPRIPKFGEILKKITVFSNEITYFKFGRGELYKTPLETKEKN